MKSTIKLLTEYYIKNVHIMMNIFQIKTNGFHVLQNIFMLTVKIKKMDCIQIVKSAKRLNLMDGRKKNIKDSWNLKENIIN